MEQRGMWILGMVVAVGMLMLSPQASTMKLRSNLVKRGKSEAMVTLRNGKQVPKALAQKVAGDIKGVFEKKDATHFNVLENLVYLAFDQVESIGTDRKAYPGLLELGLIDKKGKMPADIKNIAESMIFADFYIGNFGVFGAGPIAEAGKTYETTGEFRGFFEKKPRSSRMGTKTNN